MSDTICYKLLETVKKNSDRIAVMYKPSDRWLELSWSGYFDVIQSIAAGLQTMGVRKGDRVAILSNSRFEWAATDLAILGLGAVTVPIYQSSTPEDIEYILNDSTARILICESVSSARRVREMSKSIKSLETILCFEAEKNPSDTGFLSLDDLRKKGEVALKLSPTLYELAVRQTDLEDVATIVYTSGTTGRPKGVVLTHTQALSEVADSFPLLGVTIRDRSLSFLPYAHVLGRIEIWGHALIGYTMAFAESIERMKYDLLDVKPTILIAVPRIFEKIYIGILAQADIGPLKNSVFKWAMNAGREISRYKVDKTSVPLELALKYRLARKLVFDKISEKLGGQLRFAVCGGAPLSQSIAEFFHAAGILILEGYGLTETTGAVAVNTPFDYRFGTVGKAIGEARFKIAADGELLVQSKKVMKEYYNNPQSTAETLIDGWLHTGDIGEISPEGYIRITDRKKDLIKTAGGKYVAPQRLEGFLKANRFVSQVHIHGDQKKYIVALLTLNMGAVEKYARDNGVSFKDRKSLVETPKIKELARQAVAEANSHLASFESIKNFAILPNDFTLESGELTPSLKVKRKVVDQNYKTLIDSIYGSD
jgi:long-chain acyl-CoA synthetase